MKVYIVECGDWPEDHGVDGYYLDRIKAEERKEELNKNATVSGYTYYINEEDIIE